MYHFIPSWYNSHRTWYDNNYLWYFRPDQLGFDDIINQVKMFDYAGQAHRLLILNYIPNLRYYLHRYDLLESDYFSIFDDIQEIETISPKTIDFRALNWPEGVEFIYSNFVVSVRKNQTNIAKVEFGEEGNLIHIDYFSDEQITKKYIFDDRGFLSSILYYQEGQEHHQDYLTPSGEWVIREYLGEGNGHVTVNPNKGFYFLKESYQNMGEIVRERYLRYVRKEISPTDTVIASFSDVHNDLVVDNYGNSHLILSVFSNRNQVSELTENSHALTQVDAVICDKIEMVDQLQSKTTKPVVHISPFDTRLSLGKSNQVKDLEVYFVTDRLSRKELKRALKSLYAEMLKNKDIKVSFVSYDRDFERRQELFQFLKETAASYERSFFTLPDDDDNLLLFFDEEEKEEPRLSFNVLLSELDVIKRLEYVRLIVDISETPDLYTQIAGISSGIPQVNKVPTEFVEHDKNGYLISAVQDLEQVIPYYFDRLGNWNRSLIYSVHKINDYTSGRLVEKIINSSK